MSVGPFATSFPKYDRPRSLTLSFQLFLFRNGFSRPDGSSRLTSCSTSKSEPAKRFVAGFSELKQMMVLCVSCLNSIFLLLLRLSLASVALSFRIRPRRFTGSLKHSWLIADTSRPMLGLGTRSPLSCTGSLSCPSLLSNIVSDLPTRVSFVSLPLAWLGIVSLLTLFLFYFRLPELTNSNGGYCHDSCRTQAWSASTLLDVLEAVNAVSTGQDSKRMG